MNKMPALTLEIYCPVGDGDQQMSSNLPGVLWWEAPPWGWAIIAPTREAPYLNQGHLGRMPRGGDVYTET